MYKNVHMSQGVYFVTKGTAVASVKNDARRESSSKQAVEDKVVGVVPSGRVFGYTRWVNGSGHRTGNSLDHLDLNLPL